MADDEYGFNPRDRTRAKILRQFIMKHGIPMILFHEKRLFSTDPDKTLYIPGGFPKAVHDKHPSREKLFTERVVEIMLGYADSVDTKVGRDGEAIVGSTAGLIDTEEFERAIPNFLGHLQTMEERIRETANKMYHKWYKKHVQEMFTGGPESDAAPFDSETAGIVARNIVAWHNFRSKAKEIKEEIKEIKEEMEGIGGKDFKGSISNRKKILKNNIEKLEKDMYDKIEKSISFAESIRYHIESNLQTTSWWRIHNRNKQDMKVLNQRLRDGMIDKETYDKRRADIIKREKEATAKRKEVMDDKYHKDYAGSKKWKWYRPFKNLGERKKISSREETIYDKKEGKRILKKVGGTVLPEFSDVMRDGEVYRARLAELKADLKNRKITKEKYKEKVAKLKEDYRPSRRGRATAYGRAINEKVGPKVMKGIILAAFVGIGVVISATFTSNWFLFGFMAWGFMYILPNPNDFEIPKNLTKQLEKAPLTWAMMNPLSGKNRYMSYNHAMWGYPRSITKISTYLFFIIGLWGMNDVAFVNIALVAISFMAYYSLKIDYDPHKPHELIESLMRFGGLGALFIPWFIFYAVFDSILLGLIAMAFFAIPPIPNDRDKSELFVMYDFYDKVLFGIIMVLVLIGYLAGWGGYLGWAGASGDTMTSSLNAVFLYFWLISGISGFFSPAMARPGIGFLMLGMATFIYASGPGQQEFFSALFGPWWPSIQNTISSITTPIGDTFSGIGNTFSSGWLLMTNPVGYATQLMNGSHAENPLGVTGAHGIEFNSFSAGLIYPNQPFMTNVILRNNGAFEAENVRLYMSIGGGDAPRKTYNLGIERVQLGIFSSSMEISSFAFNNCLKEKDATSSPLKEYYIKKSCLYTEGSSYFTGKSPEMERQYINQYSFEGNATCTVINAYDLRKKAIPLRATVIYDYKVDSDVDVSFMSKDEWNRLARDNKLDAELKFVQSQYSSAPVKFPIGTAGLKNPILATQQFHISMLIDSDMGTKSKLKKVGKIEMVYPNDWTLATTGCTGPKTMSKPVPVGDNMKITFDYTNDITAGGKIIVCHFKALVKEDNKNPMGTSPTKTYRVTAHAEYTFEFWKDVSTKVEFGGFCCHKKDCPTGYKCDATEEDGKKPTYSCIPEDSETITTDDGTGDNGNVDTNGDKEVPSVASYCKSRLDFQPNRDNGLGCLLGMGGCDPGKDECAVSSVDVSSQLSKHDKWIDEASGINQIESHLLGKLKCEKVKGYNVNACCYSSGTKDQCKAAFKAWFSQTEIKKELLSSPYLYPNEKTIHNAFKNA